MTTATQIQLHTEGGEGNLSWGRGGVYVFGFLRLLLLSIKVKGVNKIEGRAKLWLNSACVLCCTTAPPKETAPGVADRQSNF